MATSATGRFTKIILAMVLPPLRLAFAIAGLIGYLKATMKLEKVTRRTDEEKRWYDDACGTALALELVGERWSLLIVRELMFGPRASARCAANLPGISANVLTQRLEGLEAAGIVDARKLPPPAPTSRSTS